MTNTPKFTLGIRLVAGCYLIYLAYQVITGGLLGGDLHGWQFALSLLGSILFIAVGILLAVKSSKELMRISREEREQLAEKAAEEAAEEAVRAQSSSERFRQMSSLAELEPDLETVEEADRSSTEEADQSFTEEADQSFTEQIDQTGSN